MKDPSLGIPQGQANNFRIERKYYCGWFPDLIIEFMDFALDSISEGPNSTAREQRETKKGKLC
jgi:hypothetical protein